MAFILASSSGVNSLPTRYSNFLEDLIVFLDDITGMGYALFLIFLIALFVSPLLIWRWTKKTCKEVGELRSQLSHAEATKIEYLKSINDHLDRIDKIAAAAYTDNKDKEEDDNSPTRISIN